ncbi:MAG: transposase [gamma proteobacterium endosymbiont of Lamellibrachia anaximandri]|nr:transposase [gamma proteobacterium endosymbiont of Lamellibrachia anaximandri]MBL3533085.1 transposase [gamma proteobacterium endosymbiont of Lamellibrachia anaximandri]
MSNYRRANIKGATYFFTVVTKNRKPWFETEKNISILRKAFRVTMNEKPFKLEAAVILPDHLHCIWQLPEDDHDFSGRWREIKKRVSRYLDTRTNACGERPVWQRRFWEHRIRDERDWRNHMDYIHYNPVKHRLVERVCDWPWSSFHQAVAKGWYEPDWGNSIPQHVLNMEH